MFPSGAAAGNEGSDGLDTFAANATEAAAGRTYDIEVGVCLEVGPANVARHFVRCHLNQEKKVRMRVVREIETLTRA